MRWLQSREHLREACSVPRDPVRLLPVRHFLVWAVLGLNALHVHQRLIARCARIWPKMPLREHTILVDVRVAAHELEELLDFTTQLVQLSGRVLFRGAAILHHLDLVLQLLLKKCLQLLQLALVRFPGEGVSEVGELFLRPIFVVGILVEVVLQLIVEPFNLLGEALLVATFAKLALELLHRLLRLRYLLVQLADGILGRFDSCAHQ